MDEFVNIIKSGIVDAGYDELWKYPAYGAGEIAQKPVLIITNVSEPDSTEILQLQKMLEACKLQPQQYNIIRLADGQMAAWHHLREQVQPKIIFLIGILPAQ